MKRLLKGNKSSLESRFSATKRTEEEEDDSGENNSANAPDDDTGRDLNTSRRDDDDTNLNRSSSDATTTTTQAAAALVDNSQDDDDNDESEPPSPRRTISNRLSSMFRQSRNNRDQQQQQEEHNDDDDEAYQEVHEMILEHRRRTTTTTTTKPTDDSTLHDVSSSSLSPSQNENDNNNNNNNIPRDLLLSMSSSSFINNDESNNNNNIMSSSSSSLSRLQQVADYLEEHLSVKDRKYRWHTTYRQCFVGREAVDVMVQHDLAKSRRHAVWLGRALQRELNLWEHVCRHHDFADDYLFFHFLPRHERFFRTDNELDCLAVLGQAMLGGGSNNDSDGYSISSSSSSSFRSSSDGLFSTSLEELARTFEDGVQVKTHRYHLKAYPNTFVGTDAVDFMLLSGMATSRQRAVELGRTLASECGLFQHVCQDHEFKDDYLFYRLVDKDQRRPRQNTTKNTTTTTTRRSTLSLEDIAKLFEKGVRVKDRRYRLVTYRNVFVGSRAVDFMVKKAIASSRREAVQLGRNLARTYNLFEHVHQDHDFKDDFLFYRFTDPSDRRRADPALAAGSSDDNDSAGQSALDAHSVRGESEALQGIADAFRMGVKVTHHKYHFKTYRNTFVGSEAVDFMVNSSLAKTRKEAVKLGRALATEFQLFRHVTGDHDFKDDYLFYRFIKRNQQEGSFMSDITSEDDIPIEQMAETFRSGVVVKDRRYHLKLYKDTFVGREAVDFLVDSGLAESRDEAVQIGRNLAVEFDLFKHVTDDHEFKDAYLFYRITNHSELRAVTSDRQAYEMAELVEAAKAFREGVKVGDHRYRLRIYKDTFLGSEAVDFLVQYGSKSRTRNDAVQLGRSLARELNLFQHVCREHELKDEKLFYRFVNGSQLSSWNETFPRPSVETTPETNLLTESDNSSIKHSAINARLSTMQAQSHPVPEALIKTKNGTLGGWGATGASLSDAMEARLSPTHRVKSWSSSLLRTDPRYQILRSVDDVTWEIEGAVESIISSFEGYLNRKSVFSIWRPTSFDAIRKMMLGEATGKGLDIKGKSAKRGKLSAFVPFLQISDNRHKKKIRTLPKDGKVRVFYKQRKIREIAAAKLEDVAEEMVDTVARASHTLAKDRIDDATRKDALDSMLWDMSDPSIIYIDDYAPQCYGLEFPVRLFWEAYFVRQDCTRAPGSEFDTGRPSQPAFQDMNFAALRGKPKHGAPRVVVVQNGVSAMSPFELLMAYEEHGRVLPVVSDFDCFLVGTRGVTFSSPIPSEQVKVLTWLADQIDCILNSPPRPESWTVRWLEVLQQATGNGFYPSIPKFGLGDPKSYEIMENTIGRLTKSGAVRHGAECFNYCFPQELDDEFLVISNNLPGPGRWKYMDRDKLLDFLSDKIDEGYVFPLNPKWVLCDAGRWKDLYDRMMACEIKEAQASLSTWYPPESGIRERIKSIFAQYPEGFQREQGMRQLKMVEQKMRCNLDDIKAISIPVAACR